MTHGMRIGILASGLVIGLTASVVAQTAAPPPAPATPAVTPPAASPPAGTPPVAGAPPAAGAAPVQNAAATPTPPGMPPLSGSAACFLPPLALERVAVDKFLATPDDLLTRYPSGGFAMAQEVMRLVGSDIAVGTPILDLAKKANDQQASAIGSGLAQAARACVRARPDITQAIQMMITQLGAGTVATAFLSALGDVQTAAVGGLGGAGGGGGGGGAAGIGGTAGGVGTSGIGGGVANAGGSFGSISRSQLTTTGTTTTTIISVSPVR